MLRAGHGVILFTTALLILGVLMVNSAGLSVGRDAMDGWRAIATSTPAMHAALALALLLLASTLPLRRLHDDPSTPSPVPWIVLVVVALLLAVHVPSIGREVNGARRWVTIGPASFQPSEIAKWGLVLALAWHASRRGAAMRTFLRGFAAPMALVGIVCALVATEDLGTAVLIALVGAGMLLAAGTRVWHVALVVPVAAAGFVAAVLHAPYRLERLQTFLDPYADPRGAGYHMLQSMSAVSGGGLSGRGLGNGVHKFGYLPEDTTDFIFAIICEELGLLGAVLVAFLYAGLVGSGLLVLRQTREAFGRLLAFGVVLTVGLQALVNLAVVTGLAPTKGIALPLVSSGGTGWVLTAVSLGLLVALDRDNRQRETGLEPLAEAADDAAFRRLVTRVPAP